jgi:hypothetical protein
MLGILIIESEAAALLQEKWDCAAPFFLISKT